MAAVPWLASWVKDSFKSLACSEVSAPLFRSMWVKRAMISRASTVDSALDCSDPTFGSLATPLPKAGEFDREKWPECPALTNGDARLGAGAMSLLAIPSEDGAPLGVA